MNNGWDYNPLYLVYRGQTTEFFTRSALAAALNRKPGTIRMMELKGVLCRPQIKNSRKWWLYTRDQIEDLVKLAQSEGVLDPNYRAAFSDHFITAAHQILQRVPK